MNIIEAMARKLVAKLISESIELTGTNGREFSIDTSEWQAIMDVIGEAARMIDLQYDVDPWRQGTGGLAEQDECTALAEAIESQMFDRPYNTPLTFSGENRQGDPGKTISQHKTSVGRVLEFAKFLRSCGGFKIW
jgi:hypothetical protein